MSLARYNLLVQTFPPRLLPWALYVFRAAKVFAFTSLFSVFAGVGSSKGLRKPLQEFRGFRFRAFFVCGRKKGVSRSTGYWSFFCYAQTSKPCLIVLFYYFFIVLLRFGGKSSCSVCSDWLSVLNLSRIFIEMKMGFFQFFFLISTFCYPIQVSRDK